MLFCALCKEQQKKNNIVSVVIPNYNSREEIKYTYENIEVFKYPEPSVTDRSLITGQRVPEGLPAFVTYIKEQQPDVVHFHESNLNDGMDYIEVRGTV